MSTIIAETYILEIKAWQSLIMFYKKQLDVLKHKLYQAFNTPVLIKDSARLENYQVHIIAIQDYLYEIETSIQKQYDKIVEKTLKLTPSSRFKLTPRSARS